MAKPKGCKKTGGRGKGTPNKKTAIIKALCNYIVDSGLEKFELEFNKLEGKQYVDAFISLSKIATDDNITTITANKGLIEMFNQKIKQDEKRKES